MSGRRANGEGTRPRKHASGGFYAQIRVRYADGTRGRETFYGTTASDVRTKVGERRAELDRAGAVQRQHRMTVGAFLEQWLRDIVDTSVRPTTRRSYHGTVKNHLIPAFGTLELRRLTPKVVQERINALAPIVRLTKNGTPHQRAPVDLARTRGLALGTLETALDVAVRWELIPRNPATFAEAQRVGKREMRFYAPEEVDTLLGAAGDDRLATLYLLAIFSGMREGELLGLLWENIDLERGLLHVSRQLNDLTRERDEPKTAAGVRAVDVSPTIVRALRAHRARMLAEGYPHGFVFCNTQGGALRASNVQRRSWKPLIRRAGVKDVRFHDLRHTAATLMFAAGVQPIVVARRLGHASPDYTMRIYGHLLPQLQRGVTERVEAFIASARDVAAEA